MTERQCYESDMVHTNENSFCRYVGWSLEIDIFEVKMMVKSGLDYSSDNLLGQFSVFWQIFLHWAAVNLKGLVEFQNEIF